tara:strand:+ start:1468 stop:1719 length:252 start_codon:yes stop_codon:yes gene_type:complete
MTDTIDTETGEVIDKPKKKKKKNSKKKPGPINLFTKLKRAGSSIRDYIRDNPSEILLTTIAILMVDVDGSLDAIEDLSEDFMS